MVSRLVPTICSNFSRWFRWGNLLLKHMYGSKVWLNGNLLGMCRNSHFFLPHRHLLLFLAEYPHLQCLNTLKARNWFESNFLLSKL